MSNKSINKFINNHKTILVILLLGLFLLEIQIFALATMKSGRKSWLQVLDDNGKVIHETDGENLSEFNKYYFERTFGPFENYQVKLEVVKNPFPFRAWFVAALGLPLGIMLLFAFILRAYWAIYNGSKSDNFSNLKTNPNYFVSGIDVVLNKITRMNIFLIGFLVFVMVIAYWIIPNMISYIGKTGIEIIMKFKWFFMLTMVLLCLVTMWIIYLKYRLAKIGIQSRTEIEKQKLNSSSYLPKIENNIDNK